MKILIIGGTGFIGPSVVRHLQGLGHTVAVFHRGSSTARLSPDVAHILGDRRTLEAHKEDLLNFAPDIVVDLVLSSGAQAEVLMRTFRGVAKRVVVISSQDVYRAAGVFHRMESGPLAPLPLAEDSRLRTNLHPYRPQVLKRLQSVFGWLDDEYDKIPVERTVLADEELPATVLRLPMVYGPGDPLHRFFPVLKRIEDGRQRILFSQDVAAWRSPRGFVENVAAAIALAATSERVAGRIYNVAEEPAFSELEWAQQVAAEAGWRGEFVVLPQDRTPKHLLPAGNFAQHWVVSSQRIRQELGYQEKVSLHEALRRTIAWERATPPAEISPDQFDYAAEDGALS
jgi:nucleoside-diphosphate-sugar epimerase